MIRNASNLRFAPILLLMLLHLVGLGLVYWLPSGIWPTTLIGGRRGIVMGLVHGEIAVIAAWAAWSQVTIALRVPLPPQPAQQEGNRGHQGKQFPEVELRLATGRDFSAGQVSPINPKSPRRQAHSQDQHSMQPRGGERRHKLLEWLAARSLDLRRIVLMMFVGMNGTYLGWLLMSLGLMRLAGYRLERVRFPKWTRMKGSGGVFAVHD